MKNSFQIKIGNELFLNKVGILFTVIGILFGLLIFLVLFAGTYLPLEMKLIFYFELIGKNIYIAFLTSILVIILGFKMSELKIYTETTLILEENKIFFKKNGELIELPKWKINRIIKRKNYNRNTEKIRIKTNVGKEYDLKVESGILKKLKIIFPYKIRLN